MARKAKNQPAIIPVPTKDENKENIPNPSKKILKIKKNDPTSNVILEKVIAQFEYYKGCHLESRKTEMEELKTYISDNISKNMAGNIVILADDMREGADLVNKVLSDHFGMSEDCRGGEEPRVFVFTYSARNL